MMRMWSHELFTRDHSRARWNRHPARPLQGPRYQPLLESLEDRTLLSFLPPVNYDVGYPFNHTSVAAGDLRGNGTSDLVVTRWATNSVDVLLGNGDGTFQSAQTYNAVAFSVTVGDLRDNGTLDIVSVGGYGGGGLSVLLGNGDGTFQPAEYFNFGATLSAVAVGRFRGATFPPDLVIGGTWGVGVLLGNGDGTFQPPQVYSLHGLEPEGVAVGDFRGNGQLDIVTANNDGDSNLEVSVLLGNGDGTFQPPVNYSSGVGAADARSVSVGDLRGNGILDLVLASQYGKVSVLLGNGDGTFQAPVLYNAGGDDSQQVALGRFRGPEFPLDIAVANGSFPQSQHGTVGILLGNGDGTFQTAVPYEAGPFPYSVAVGDFTGDGFPDLAVANRGNFSEHDSSVSVFLNAADWSSPSGPGALRGSFPLAAREFVAGDAVFDRPNFPVTPTAPAGSLASVTGGALVSEAAVDSAFATQGKETGTFLLPRRGYVALAIQLDGWDDPARVDGFVPEDAVNRWGRTAGWPG